MTMRREYRQAGWGQWGLIGLGLLVFSGGDFARAQAQPDSSGINAWQRYDWLSDGQKQAAASASATVTVTPGQETRNPFDVVNSGALWQEKVGTTYTRQLGDGVALSYETSQTDLNEASTASGLGSGPDDLYRGQKVGLQFQPVDDLTLRANLHDSTTEAALPGDAVDTNGGGFSAEGHLPMDSTLTLAFNSDRSGTDTTASSTSGLTAYDAQLRQPLGKLPLTALFKGHYEQATAAGAPASRSPSLEQSLIWKPAQETTFQMGLRQQHYQEYPGIDDQFNSALFADWSQNLAGSISWHSYAEVLNTRSLVDQAPASPIASGSNGTPQATAPNSNVSVAGALPVSLTDQTLTFSTGPSIQLQKDISASVEYSNRWDKNPAAGNVGEEQRVSLSVKGSF